MLIALGMWVCLILGIVFFFKLVIAGHILLGCLVAIFFFVIVFVISDFDTPKNKELVNAMLKDEQDKKRKKQAGYKCPNCGKMSGHKIGTISKSVSVGVMGLASDKIGKTYKCSNCNYIW